jgi:small subunit ribosomal protein S17
VSDTTTTEAAPVAAGEPAAVANDEAAAAAAPADSAGAGTAATSGDAAAEAVPAGAARSFRKVREGLVVSDKMTKTVVVAVEDRVQHPLYGKTIRRTKRVKAHDENGVCGVGDRVLLMETRPLSANKRWRVVDILEKAK